MRRGASQLRVVPTAQVVGGMPVLVPKVLGFDWAALWPAAAALGVPAEAVTEYLPAIETGLLATAHTD